MLSGIPTIFGINPYEESSTPEHTLGSIGITADGRYFRYAKAGATLVAGDLLQGPAQTADLSLIPTATAVGATSVTLTTGAAVTANLFADGYLVVSTTAGNGIYYRIKKHAATTGAASLVVYLKDPVKVAITASSTIDLVKNPFNGVIQNPAVPTSCIVGVASKAITTAYYGWIQTKGSAAVLAGGNITVGRIVVANIGTAASVIVGANAVTEAFPIVGIAQTTIATGEHATVFLSID